MNGVTYGTGALVAADHNDRRMWALHAGFLAGKARHDDIVDVTVVEGAIRRHDAVVTSNHTHIRKIADAVHAKIAIEQV